MTLGFHSPLAPRRTGVADYAAALLGELRARGQVLVNSRRSAQVELYQLGNNQLHRGIYRRAIERPGVVVLHDAVLHHFFLGALTEDGYVEEFVYNYGDWSRDFARELWRERSRSAQDARYFRFPMLRRIAETSRALVVHNPAAAARVREHVAGARVVEIPHLFAQPELPPAYEVIRLRARLGLTPRTTLFGVFGHLRESKRLFPILRAFERVHRKEPETALVVAGEFVSSDLARALVGLLDQPGVLRAGYLSERDFWLYASAVDACINLRYPAAGETSGIAIRLMGIGKPLLVTAAEECSRFPETACIRIDGGVAEEEMLAAYMLWLDGAPEARRRVGEEAARHIGAHHGLAAVAARFVEALGWGDQAF